MKIIYLSLLCSVLLVNSCAKRNFVYFENLTDASGQYVGEYKLPAEPRIKIGSELGIRVSSLSPQSDQVYNGGLTQTATLPRYVVDAQGNIELPLLGSIKVVDLTRSELRERIKGLVSESLQKPAVDVQFLNNTITVIGEVTEPQTFTISGDQFTLLQALGQAGDLTVYGKRDRVTVIREVNGRRTAARLDLNDPALFDSPYYFLQANDVVYVEPVKTKAEQASVSRANISIAVSILSVIAIVLVQGGRN